MIATAEPPTLKTERLILRPLKAADAAAITLYAGDFDVARMTTAIPHPFARKDAESFIARMTRADPAREMALAIEHRQEGLIGVIGIHPTPDGAAEIGYWLGRPFWGAGCMTEAVGAALAWVRRSWNKRVLASGHFADNPASGAVLIKSGFLYTGVVTPRFSRARDAPADTRMMIWLA